MKTYYEEVKGFIKFCSDMQHFVDDELVEIGVDMTENCHVALNIKDESICFYNTKEGREEPFLRLHEGSDITELFNNILYEITPFD